MDFQEFSGLMQDLATALRWHSLTPGLLSRMHEIVGSGEFAIPEEEVLTIVGTAMGEPGTAPASVIQALKAAKERHIRNRINPAFNSNIKPFDKMTGPEQTSYLAAIAVAKARYIAPMTEARAAGKLPQTQVEGFSSMADLVPEAVL